MTVVPDVRYARRDGKSLAYQQAGRGRDLLVLAGAPCTSAVWPEPAAAPMFRDLATTARLTTFDQRGAGRSDPIDGGHPLPLVERVADLLAVAEAADVSRPVLVAMHDCGPVALLAATSSPDRFSGLALVNCLAQPVQ